MFSLLALAAFSAFSASQIGCILATYARCWNMFHGWYQYEQSLGNTNLVFYSLVSVPSLVPPPHSNGQRCPSAGLDQWRHSQGLSQHHLVTTVCSLKWGQKCVRIQIQLWMIKIITIVEESHHQWCRDFSLHLLGPAPHLPPLPLQPPHSLLSPLGSHLDWSRACCLWNYFTRFRYYLSIWW